MDFDSLLFCDDLASLNTICKVLEDAHMGREICTDAGDAAQILRSRKFDSVIVDCDDMEGGLEFLRNVRRVGLNKFAIVLALINGSTNATSAFEMGANFVIDKPVAPELLLRSMRAAEGFMLREQRRFFRLPVDMLVAVGRPQRAEVHYTARNLSEGGMALQSAGDLLPGNEIAVHFKVPDAGFDIQATAEVVWVGANHVAGLKFIKISGTLKARLRHWLGLKFEEQAPSVFFPFPSPSFKAS